MPGPPEGYGDYAVDVPSFGDRFAPYAPVDPEAPALIVAGGGVHRRGDRGAGAGGTPGAGADRAGLAAAVGSGVRHVGGAQRGVVRAAGDRGSVVLCRHLEQATEEAVAKRIEAERVTATVR
ncbi:hypothetical protein GCM10020256_46900 [Streptomyces thermocoprophilus]